MARRDRTIQTTVVVSKSLLRDFDAVARARGFAHRPPFFMHLIGRILEGKAPKIPTLPNPEKGVRMPLRIPVLLTPVLDEAVAHCGHTMRTKFLAGLMQYTVDANGDAHG